METSTGKRTSRITAQLVEDGDSIEMWARELGRNPIVFRKDTGRSGPKAYGKLVNSSTRLRQSRSRTLLGSRPACFSSSEAPRGSGSPLSRDTGAETGSEPFTSS
jgi:hypothetical protein